MAKKSAALVAAETKIAALEARIQLAIANYRNMKQHIADLESQLAARGAQKVIPVRAEPETKVTEYTKRDGSRWVKTQCGNVARHMRVDETISV